MQPKHMILLACLLCTACSHYTEPEYSSGMYIEYFEYSLDGSMPYDVTGEGTSQAELEVIAKQLLETREIKFYPVPSVKTVPVIEDRSMINAERGYSISHQRPVPYTGYIHEESMTVLAGEVTTSGGEMLLDLYENYTATPPVAHLNYRINLAGAQNLIDEVKDWRSESSDDYKYSEQTLEVDVELRSTDEEFPWSISCKQSVRALAKRLEAY